MPEIFHNIKSAIQLKNRRSFVKQLNLNGSILEIGPFFAPLVKGKNVKYFDILNQEELKARAIEHNYAGETDQIPYIDYCSKTGDLSVIDEKFDEIISCHVIEHQLDLVKHLNDVANLLEKGGKYYLVIPDQRYCFDHFNTPSTYADVIEATVAKRKKHSIKNVLNHLNNVTHNNAKKHWLGIHGSTKDSAADIAKTIEEFNQLPYIDVHAWFFTPNSFEHLIEKLNTLGMIELEIEELQHTAVGRFEFNVILRKKG